MPSAAGATASAAGAGPTTPFEFAISEKVRNYGIRRAPEHLLGLEVEYQDMHYIPPQTDEGKYVLLEKAIFACTKEKDGAGNHLFKIVGEGQFLDLKNNGHDHCCIEVVTAPLTHAQWKNEHGVLGAFKVMREMRKLIRSERVFLLSDFVQEYNQQLRASGVDDNFALIADERFATLTIDLGHKREGTSTQSNFTVPFELLDKNIRRLSSLTADTRHKVAKKTKRQAQRVAGAQRRAREIVSEHFDGVGSSDVNKNMLRSFFLLFFLLEATYAAERAIKPGQITKFMYPWLSRATMLDVIHSVLSQRERQALYSYMKSNEGELHRAVELIAGVKVNFEQWHGGHLDPLIEALGNQMLVDERSGLMAVGRVLRGPDDVKYDVYFSPQGINAMEGRIPPLDIGGVPSIVVESRAVSKINKLPTPELLKELGLLYQ